MGVMIQDEMRVGDRLTAWFTNPDEFQSAADRKDPVAELAPDAGVLCHALPFPRSFSFSIGRGFHARYP